MRAHLIAGPAGSGKSTLGRALAARVGAVLLDLDTVTNPLLDDLFAWSGLPGHWNDDRHRGLVRPARYAALRAVAADQVATGLDVVLVAPFTAELRGGTDWDLMRAALSPADLRVVWLDADGGLLRDRVRDRGEPRDAAESTLTPTDPPLVAHLRVPAELPTSEQVDRVTGAPEH